MIHDTEGNPVIVFYPFWILGPQLPEPEPIRLESNGYQGVCHCNWCGAQLTNHRKGKSNMKRLFCSQLHTRWYYGMSCRVPGSRGAKRRKRRSRREGRVK